MNRIDPGDKVKDSISGLVGIVTGRFEYLYGCVRVAIQPQEVKDGKPVDSYVIDEEQAEVLERRTVERPAPEVASPRTSGGPRPDPAARASGERR